MRISILAAVVAAGALSACSSSDSGTSTSGSTASSTTAATSAGSTAGSTTASNAASSTSATTTAGSSTGSPGSTSSTGSPSSTSSTGTSATTASTNGSTTGTTSATTGSQGWHTFAMPLAQQDSDILGVVCTATDKCAIATFPGSASDPGGRVFALTPSGVGATLLDGTYDPNSTTDLPALAHQLGDISFIGFSVTPQGVVARGDNENLFCLNSGDVTSASAWQAMNTGNDTTNGPGVGGFRPLAIQGDANNHWVLVPELTGVVVTSTAAPSASTPWTEVWDPLSSPSVPTDFDSQYAADPTLCNTQVTAGGLPSVNHAVAIATDLSVIVGPSGGLNQSYTDMQSAAPRPGVCVSTDLGQHFYYSAFNNLPGTVATDSSNPGPLGVNCTTKDACYAFSGEADQAGTAYIYYSSNASQGVNST